MTFHLWTNKDKLLVSSQVQILHVVTYKLGAYFWVQNSSDWFVVQNLNSNTCSQVAKIHIRSYLCMKNLVWGILKKTPEFSYSFQVFSFLWNPHRCFSVALGQKAHVPRMCVLPLFHSCAILMIRNLVSIAENLQELKGEGSHMELEDFKVLPALHVLPSTSTQQQPATTESYLYSRRTVGVWWLRSSKKTQHLLEQAVSFGWNNNTVANNNT